ERLVYLDQYSGKVLAETGWDASWGSLAQATSWGIDAHMGRQVGVVNGIAMGATCLGVLVSCITAPIMYLKRRRRGSLGIPRRPVGVTLPPWTRVGVIVICAIYPLLGASMILVWIIDRVLIRRVPALEAIFSHTTSTP
ncbi:MAG: PepSY domain-containing protein, partial [Actinobacteria bacterium]|nr:PepSY domain-containing protein [Actinomycetota bacterium]